MVYFINDRKENMIKCNDRIECKKDKFYAIEVSQLKHYFDRDEFELECVKLDKKIGYYLMQESNLEDDTVLIMVDIPECDENLIRMICGSKDFGEGFEIERLLLPYIDKNWIVDSIDCEKLFESMPDEFDISVKYNAVKDNSEICVLTYNDGENELKADLEQIIYQQEQLANFGLQEDVIDASDKFEEVLDKYREQGNYPFKLINRLESAMYFMIEACNFGSDTLVNKIFDEYYWNEFLSENSFALEF